MAALHKAFESLSPTPFSSVPTSASEATSYLQTAFREAKILIDSVPLPPPTDPLVAGRPRSSTSASVASNVSEIASSSARSEPLDPSNVALQKEWGKPIKLNPKDNPLGMAVYKCSGKDGNGAWFARRSVHEGLGFNKWKLSLQREFPETLEVQGGPGEGNIRGIGGERRVEKMDVNGVGAIEVYHLSAQFPGPTTPRDFVTLLLTSSSAFIEPASGRPSSPPSSGRDPQSSKLGDTPRHFIVISRPCIHPDCPRRDGFIRGQYESVEFIREIPKKSKKMSSSMTDLPKSVRISDESLEKQALLRKAAQVVEGDTESLSNGENLSAAAPQEIVQEGRKRGKTISFAQSRGSSAKGEAMDNPKPEDENETNPVEWIMVTRSDPGGSVPRFMVERGTPGGIVADASKFLDWACKKEHPEGEEVPLEKDNTKRTEEKRKELEAFETNGHLAGLDGYSEGTGPAAGADPKSPSLQMSPILQQQEQEQGGLFSFVAGAAYASLETYAPQAVIDRLPQHQQSSNMVSNPAGKDTESGPTLPDGHTETGGGALTPTISSNSTTTSFASAEDHFDGEAETQSTRSTTSNAKSSNSKDTAGLTPHEKQLAKLQDRKRQLNEKLAKAREKQLKDKEQLTSKEQAAVKKAEEKHQKEVQKQEERYKKEIAKLEVKRQKEAAKLVEQKKKAEDKDEKSRLYREKDELKQELDVMSKERDILREQVGALQRENTSFVVRLGKFEEGKDLLKEVKSELDVNRSRSSSLKRGKGTPEKGKEATILGGEKQEGLEAMR